MNPLHPNAPRKPTPSDEEASEYLQKFRATHPQLYASYKAAEAEHFRARRWTPPSEGEASEYLYRFPQCTPQLYAAAEAPRPAYNWRAVATVCAKWLAVGVVLYGAYSEAFGFATCGALFYLLASEVDK